MENNFIAKVLDNNHPKLFKLKLLDHVNITIDNDEVYIYLFPSLKNEEFKCVLKLSDAKKHLTCVKKIASNIKSIYLKKTNETN